MNIEDNIWKFGIYSFIDHIRLVWMISTLYLLWLGFSFTSIGIYQTIFAVVIVLLELPTGAIADIIGKKKSVVISSLLAGLGFLSIGLMNLPAQYYVIALIMGIAFSFNSGAEVALLYDTVKKIKREKEYKKIRGKINACNQIASIFGVLLGPALYVINPRLGFIISGVVYLFAAVAVSTMVEPYPCKKSLTIQNQWIQTKKSFRFAINHNKFLWLVGFFFVSTIGLELFYDLWQQPLLVNLGFEVKYFGVIFISMMAVRALISWYTHKIENKLQERSSLLFILLAQVLLFAIFGFSNAIVLLFAFGALYGVMAFQDIVFEDYINSHISSSNRATVLSVKSLIYNILTAGLYVFAGFLTDTYSLQYVLVGVSVFILIGTLLLFSLINGSIASNKPIA